MDSPKGITDAINENNIEKVKVLLSSGNFKINEIDDNGMTLLQHACFKGHLELVDYLLMMGADVNSNDHKMGYTTLMFAALSGKENVVIRLLNAGAKVHHTNSVGRTASQMAAFIGNHRVATVINNYIERAEIAVFSVPNGFKKEVRLPIFLVDPVHILVNEVNFSPVKVSLTLRREGLISHWTNVANVLEIISKQNFEPHDTNEGLSIKFFVIAVIVRQAGESYKSGDADLSQFIKKLLIGIPPSGLPEGQEKLLRLALRQFPHLESQLYRIIVSQLARVPLGANPTAMELLSSRVNGQLFFRSPEAGPECSTCFSLGDHNRRCADCSVVAYCDQACQRLHWFTHRRFCKQLRLEASQNKSEDEVKNNGDIEIHSKVDEDAENTNKEDI